MYKCSCRRCWPGLEESRQHMRRCQCYAPVHWQHQQPPSPPPRLHSTHTSVSVFSFLRQLTTWHCSHLLLWLLAAATIDQYLLLAGPPQWHAVVDRQTDGHRTVTQMLPHTMWAVSKQDSAEQDRQIVQIGQHTHLLPICHRNSWHMACDVHWAHTRDWQAYHHYHGRDPADNIPFPTPFHGSAKRQCGFVPQHRGHRVNCRCSHNFVTSSLVFLPSALCWGD